MLKHAICLFSMISLITVSGHTEEKDNDQQILTCKECILCINDDNNESSEENLANREGDRDEQKLASIEEEQLASVDSDDELFANEDSDSDKEDLAGCCGHDDEELFADEEGNSDEERLAQNEGDDEQLAANEDSNSDDENLAHQDGDHDEDSKEEKIA